MALVWRLADPRFADDIEGSGNRVYGARWNSPGRGILYTSENLSLCVLETLVHLSPAMRQRLPARAAIRISYPDDAKVPEIRALPGKDRAAFCRKRGDQWLDQANTLVLKAPSVVVPLEFNVMFNPLHPAMRDVRIVDRIPFTFDTRFF
ncbi:MAG: RES family NAD+ phosphorylase [Aestuariivirga sp.]